MNAKTRRLFKQAADVPWWIHRVATSEEYNDGLHTVRNKWSTLDLYHAHKALDVFADLKEENQPEKPKT